MSFKTKNREGQINPHESKARNEKKQTIATRCYVAERVNYSVPVGSIASRVTIEVGFVNSNDSRARVGENPCKSTNSGSAEPYARQQGRHVPGERRGGTRLHCGPRKVDKARVELGTNCDDSPPRPPPPYKPGREQF